MTTEVAKPDTGETNIALLPPAQRAMIVLDSTKTEVQLHQIVQEAGTVVAVGDKTTREYAHRIGMKLKTARTSIEKIGKAAREDAQAFSKAVIGEENRLKAIMAAEEERIFALRDAYDKKVADEKAAAERAEAERVAGIRAKIDAFKRLPLESAQDSAEELQATIEDLSGIVIDGSYAEFAEEATLVVAGVMSQLLNMRDAAVRKAEAEAAVAAERERVAAEELRLKEERESFERERAEFEARKAAEQKPADVIETGIVLPAGATLVDPGTPGAITVEKGGTSVSYVVAEPIVVVENVATASPDATLSVGSVGDDPDAFDNASQYQDEIEANDEFDVDTFVREVARFTALQFNAMAKKVAAVESVVAAALIADLENIANGLLAGHFNEQIKAGDWVAMGNADKEMALASQACVTLVFGEEVGGRSVLLEAAE